jgi:alanyl-tRNA synthetase
VVKIMGEVYPEIERNKKFIFDELEKEEEKFSTALEGGIKVLEKKLQYLRSYSEAKETGKTTAFPGQIPGSKKELNAKGAFDLFQSYGFPLEMTVEMCKEKGFSVDVKGFEELLKQHQELSRKGAEQKFKGGLADASDATTKLHTCAHLTLAALKELLDEKIEQKGANITAERLRFDFNFDRRVEDSELKKIEAWVNKAIGDDCDVRMEILSLDEAKKSGAHGTFTSKYGEQVKVYTITGKSGKIYSKEICGGPHVTTTKGIGKYKITKEESSSAGVRRIKAVLE